ncbi:FAD-binding monooxygenase, partial [Bacillus thuringiensis]|nr:FAD-binding monooxygenase [Bacillus thuringiensis]
LLIHPTYIDKINKINIDSHIKVIIGEIQDSKLKNIDTVLIRPDGHIATIEYTKIDNCE